MKTTAKAIPYQCLYLPLAAALGLAAAYTGGAVSYPATVLADNPIAYYRLEDPAGSMTVTNSASAAYPADLTFDDTLTWPKLGQPGVGSNSVSFHLYSGQVQRAYISAPYTPDLNPKGPFTLEAWVRPMSSGAVGEWRVPVGCFNGWAVPPASGWFFYQAPPDSGNSWIWVEAGGGVWVGGVPIRKGQWDHLAASFDGTTVRFFVNGVYSGSGNAATAPVNTNSPFCIGQRGDNSCFFDGYVDEVALYTNALTTNQIQLHYQVGLTNFYNGPIAAYVSQDPASATSYAGRSASFVVTADGTAPLSYQWYKGTTPISGATNDTYTFNCAYGDNNAQYKVAVTNLYGGATSAPATLTVLTDLTLDSSPATIVRNVGSKAAFHVGAGGALPLTYKWYKGANVISGATDATLWLSNVQLTDDGSAYHAEVSNPWNTTNSDTAFLSVVPRLYSVPITRYAQVVMADDPVAYWRLDEGEGSATAVDAAGSFDGTYDATGAGSYTPGLITFGMPTGIPYETNKAVAVTNGARVTVPYALELNPYGPFAIEGWFKPATLAVDGNDYRTVFSSEGTGVGGPIGWLFYQQPNNTWTWVLFADNWASTFVPVTGSVVANNWYYIVLQYDGSLYYVYVNGVLAGSQRYDTFVLNKNGAINLGWRSDNDWKPFVGTIDDVACYNKTLTPDQIQAHYKATVKLTMARSGNNVILSWPFGTLQQADSAMGLFADMSSATSPHTNSIGSVPKYYRVRVPLD